MSETCGMAIETFRRQLDEELRFFIRDTFERVRADEGSVWLADEESGELVIAFNTGKIGQDLSNTVRQPLSEGLISMVYATEQGFLESNVQENEAHSKQVDQMLAQKTISLMAVPFYIRDTLCGVLSCVQLESFHQDERNIAGFDSQDLRRLANLSIILGRMIELQVIHSAPGANQPGPDGF